jgi:hypothetical protein
MKNGALWKTVVDASGEEPIPVCESLTTNPASQLDQGPWQPRPGAIKEDSHAQGFGALRSHQPHLSADVIDVVESIQLRLIVRRIPCQTCNSLFDSLTETRTDLKAFLGSAVRSHCELLGAGLPEVEFFFIAASSFFCCCR